MSVAFRRDSDEEHKEPRPELPIPVGPNLVTPRGLALIEAKVAEREAALAAGGDEAAIEAIKRELRYWHVRRATAQVTPAHDDGEAGFGTRVRFRQNGEDRTVDIVGDDEAEPTEGRIAFSAPLARALIGAGEGDRVDFAGKAAALKILSVKPIPEA
ncbi:Transcription elongation factor, GreA/GreB family [Sphingomonas laterariae]|uniref:Transcription elongation factor, GreA/GreB family n=1 Tax=Edaphosphingomonas laterariae TaxID=861865 RepID=A0A239HAY9_9SPHN|nr:GreA/GreB family elongation factor [Sphingomonas laterariae]SNS78315.1 Transcription elongation factor, GreA/GreB family [Sphingomonas laterariae]